MSHNTQSLDANYNDVLSKLNTYKNSHPNLYNLWHHYLSQQKNKLTRDITKCYETMERFDHHNDVTVDNLITTLFILNCFDLNR